MNNLTLLKEYNFRDLGNHLTQTGQKIKPKTLFRSSKLFGISKIDVDLLQSYGITKVIDFRSANEIKKAPDPDIKNIKNIKNIVIPIFYNDDSELTEFPIEFFNKSDAGFQHMIKTYDQMINQKQSKLGYKKFFKLLLSHPKDESLLFHCSMGKDRIGIASLFLLYILGVDMNDIFHDYLLSNKYLINVRKENIEYVNNHSGNVILMHNLLSLSSAKEEYINRVLNVLDKEYGGILRYINTELGISSQEIEELKDRYLF